MDYFFIGYIVLMLPAWYFAGYGFYYWRHR